MSSGARREEITQRGKRERRHGVLCVCVCLERERKNEWIVFMDDGESEAPENLFFSSRAAASSLASSTLRAQGRLLLWSQKIRREELDGRASARERERERERERVRGQKERLNSKKKKKKKDEKSEVESS